MKLQRYFFVLLTIGVLVFSSFSFAKGPSFSCEKASTKNEKLICANSRLSELDYDLGKLYSHLVKSLEDSKASQLRKTQRAWLKKRDINCLDINCLEKRYKERIAELTKYSEEDSSWYEKLSKSFSKIWREENEYYWDKKDWKKYIYDKGFIRCGDDEKIASANLNRVNSFSFNYKTKCIRPPKVDYGWYNLTWDKRPLDIIKLGTPDDYVILLTVQGAAATNAWDKTLVYKKSGDHKGAIIAEIIGWMTDLEIQTDAKIQLNTSGWMYDNDDPMCCASYRVYTKLEISKNGIKVKERFFKPTKHYYAKLKRKKRGKAKARKIVEVSERISRIASSSSYSPREKKQKIRVVQNSVSKEIFVKAIRKLPIVDNGKFVTFDTYMRKQVARPQSHRSSSRSSSRSSPSPIERDPIGAGMSIFFDSSAGNIKKQLGLP